MRAHGTFEVAIPPPRVAAYLANPRNLIAANHQGPVVDQSTGPMRAGSWFLLAFDQLRARVEYTEFDPPHRVAAVVSMSGFGSLGYAHSQHFGLTELDGGSRTRVHVIVEGKGGVIRWGPLVRAFDSLSMRQLKKRIEASA